MTAALFGALLLPEEELREWINSVYAQPMRNYIKSMDDEDTVSIGDGPALRAGYLKGLINKRQKKSGRNA